MKKLLTFAAATLVGVLAVNAVPAKRVYRTYTQPDGTTVTAMKVGDEFGHYYVAKDGRAMLRDAAGTLRIADDDAIKTVRQRADKRRQNRMNMSAKAQETGSKYHGIGHFSAPYPRTGKVKSIVFLVEYKDVKFRTPDPKTYFTRQLNEPGFNENGAMGSARDFFLTQSHGLFDPDFEVYGPIELAHEMSYYGGTDPLLGEDAHAGEMIIEAAQQLDDQIDFSQYDLDNDGNIDNVFAIYAGYGEADTDYEDTVWPHAFELYEEIYGQTFNFDGKRLFGYACANEITPPSPTKPGDTPNGIATFCHEFSHVLGLPDLYNTQNSYDMSTPSSWDIMDYGSYNNDGRTPPNYSAVERNAMGWLFPQEFVGPESVKLKSLTQNNEAYIIPTNLDNEFFVVENRQQDGWDTYLPGHGLLVWHISFNQTIWDANEPNVPRRGFNIGVDIVEAGGFADASTDKDGNPLYLDQYSFPGSQNKTSLTADTYPALRTWAGNAIDFPITDIEEADGVVSFNVCGGRIDFGDIAAPVLKAADNGTITVSWAAHPKALDYQLTVTCGGEVFGEYSDFSVGNVTTYIIPDVAGERDYAVKVRAVNGRQFSAYSPEATVTTPAIDFIYLTPKAISAVRDEANAVLTWEALDGAASYALTVEAEADGGFKTDTHDFGKDDVLSIPEGWTWTGRSSDIYKSTTTPKSLIESGAPVLKMAKDQVELSSGIFSGEVSRISFWLVANSTSANIKSILDVQVRSDVDAQWTSVLTVDNVNAYEGKGAQLTAEVPAGMHQLRFIYTKPQGGGNIGIDNVAVTVSARTFSKLIDRRDMGQALTHTIDIPAQATALRFYVEGVDDTGRYSRPSNTVTIDLLSGIGNIASAHVGVSVAGRDVIYRGAPDARMSLVNLAGIVVASAATDASGEAMVTASAPGVYIVVTPEGSAKVTVK